MTHGDGGGRPDAPDPRGRDDETLHREVDELAAELRMVIPGVTVMFGFLLSAPLSSGFPSLTSVQRGAYFTAFLSSALAVTVLLAVAAYHRLRGKPYDKGTFVRTANRQAAVGLVFVALALTAVVFLVTDLLYGPGTSVPVTGALAMVVAGTWFALPLHRRDRGDR